MHTDTGREFIEMEAEHSSSSSSEDESAEEAMSSFVTTDSGQSPYRPQYRGTPDSDFALPEDIQANTESEDSDFDLAQLREDMEREIVTDISVLQIHISSSSSSSSSAEDDLPADPLEFMQALRAMEQTAPEPDLPLTSYCSQQLIAKQQQQREQTQARFDALKERSPSPIYQQTDLKQMGLVGDRKRQIKWRTNYIMYRHITSAYDVTTAVNSDIDLLSIPPPVEGYDLTQCCHLRMKDCMCDESMEANDVEQQMDTEPSPQTPESPHGVNLSEPQYTPPPHYLTDLEDPHYLSDLESIEPQYETDEAEFEADSPQKLTPSKSPSKMLQSTPCKLKQKRQLQLKLTPIKGPSTTEKESSDDSLVDFCTQRKRKKRMRERQSKRLKNQIPEWDTGYIKPKVTIRAYNQGDSIPKCKPPPKVLTEDMVLLPGIDNECVCLKDLEVLIPRCFKYMCVPADGNCLWHAIAKSTMLTSPMQWEKVKQQVIQHHRECYRHTSQISEAAAELKAQSLVPCGTWGDEFDLESYCHSSDHVAFCHNRDADHWMVHNPTSTRPIFISYSNKHFASLWPITPSYRVDIKWIQKILREMVINKPTQWPTLQPKLSLMKYRPPKRPIAAVSPRSNTGEIIQTPQPVDLSGTITWPHGEPRIIDTIASEEAETLSTSLKIVNVTLRRYYEHNQNINGV